MTISGFWTPVESTGVPKPENLLFFATPWASLKSGDPGAHALERAAQPHVVIPRESARLSRSSSGGTSASTMRGRQRDLLFSLFFAESGHLLFAVASLLQTPQEESLA